jgi:hypothetical protein
MGFFKYMQTAFAFAMLLALPALVQAQGVTTSSINGRVVDEITGEALIGANILATHEPSGSMYGNSTDLDGFFRIPGMRVGGPYTVVISYTGYEAATYNNVYISLGQGANLNVQLRDAAIELGGVEVVASRADLFSSDRTGASTRISSQTLETAPTISRSINDFTRLTPQSNGTSFGGRDNRFNNYSIDGNIYNNNFGLGSSQFAGGNPISLDAVEEVQVSLAPYDVRQGGFSGANVNAVTRSGSNNWEGSAYLYFRNQNFTGDRIGETTFSVDNSQTVIRGARLGGAIIKNKLFFFVSVEQEEAAIPSLTKVAARDGLAPDGLNVSRVPSDRLDRVRDAMSSLYDYDTGDYENYLFANRGLRLNARVDYNINQKHKVFVRYNRYSSFRDVEVNGNSLRYNPSALRYQNTNRFGIEAMNFRNSHYTVDNNVSSMVAELNSLFGNNMSNTLRVGFTAVEDPIRNIPGGQAFPFIEVLEFEGETPLYYMTLGNELFSVGNLLSNNIFNITDNFSIYRGRNEFSVGANFEYMTFENAFNPTLNGVYRYNSYDNFVESVINRNPNVRPDLFLQGYSFLGPDDIPVDATNFAQLGVYGQVKREVMDNLSVTLGLRVDLPFYPIDLPRNEKLDELELEFVNPRNDEIIIPDVSVLPGVRPLIQPRFGFNWDVLNDRTFQIRGGTGTFSGRVPFVWISNQVNNNGVTRGGFGLTPNQWGVNGNPTWDGFQPDVTYYRPDPSTLEAQVSQNLALTDQNLRLPMVWRSNLAADYKLPGGFVMTLEGIYSRDLNGPLAVNVNAKAPTVEQISETYPFPVWQDGYYENTDFRDVILLTNINEGYYASGTVQLQRSFRDFATLSFAYTRSVSKDYGLEGGSQAASLWPNTVIGDRNAPELGFSRFDQPNRIVSFASLSNKYLGKQNATTLSVFYVGGEGGRFTYAYSGNWGDGANRQMYVPRTLEESFLVDRTVSGVVTTAAEQWDALDKYIEQDPYLSSIRGAVSERNGAKLPWLHRFDLRFVQDINLDIAGTSRIQLTADILNFGNMINSEWGVAPTTVQRNLLNFGGLDSEGNPRFTMNNQPGTTNFPEMSFRPNISVNQTWSAQVGFRIIFE